MWCVCVCVCVVCVCGVVCGYVCGGCICGVWACVWCVGMCVVCGYVWCVGMCVYLQHVLTTSCSLLLRMSLVQSRSATCWARSSLSSSFCSSCCISNLSFLSISSFSRKNFFRLSSLCSQCISMLLWCSRRRKFSDFSCSTFCWSSVGSLGREGARSVCVCVCACVRTHHYSQ